ncbi:MAG: hypothetical protein ACREUQ_08650, partial [Burkholderiales bacterium]
MTPALTELLGEEARDEIGGTSRGTRDEAHRPVRVVLAARHAGAQSHSGDQGHELDGARWQHGLSPLQERTGTATNPAAISVNLDAAALDD